MSFANTELLPNIANWFRPLLGIEPFNKKMVDDAKDRALKAVVVLEQHFLVHTYLVGERPTLADLFMTSLISRGFQYVLDKKFRDEHPNVTRWFETITNQPTWKAVVDKPIMIDECIKYTPPKKEPKPQKPAQAPAAKPQTKEKAKEEEEEDDMPAAPKAAKHPLEALPKPTLILDDWKRKYSNTDTRSEALPWFWEHYKPEEYSLWRVDYKYNDELTMTFMSANLIGEALPRHQLQLH
jgi:elongation factor 1-gamma